MSERNNIKRETELENNAFLSIASLTVVDMKTNPAQEILCCNLSVGNFTPDFASPFLVAFDLDLTAETLTLYFSETVNVGTFNETGITLVDLDSNAMYSLTNASVEHGDEPFVTVNLTWVDLNAIKQIVTLATSEDNTMISLTNNTIQDMNGNVLTSIGLLQAMPVSNFTRDEVKPVLEAFDLDMDASTLTLYFSETINTLSQHLGYITIQDGVNRTNYYTLTG